MALRADSIVIAGALLRWLAERGISVAALERRVQRPLTMEAGDVRVDTETFFRFWRAIEDEAVGAPSLGLSLGEEAIDRGYSVAALAAVQATHLGEALRIMGRYKRLTCPEEVVVDVQGAEAAIRFDWVLAGPEVPRLLVDSTFASLVALARTGTGHGIVPLRLELARGVDAAGAVGRHFGCAVVHGAPFDRIVLASAHLALPFVTRDADALASLAPDLEVALGRRASAAVVSDARRAIARCMCGRRPAAADVAHRMRLSARTLQRRLEAAGTTYQDELDWVRRTTAQRLLRSTRLDVMEIAFLLGFEEPNSFVRAFRTWSGETPLRWRASPGRAPSLEGASARYS